MLNKPNTSGCCCHICKKQINRRLELHYWIGCEYIPECQFASFTFFCEKCWKKTTSKQYWEVEK